MYVTEEAQGHPDRPNGVIYSPNWSGYQTYDGLSAGSINYSVIIKCFLSEDSKFKINISVLWEGKCSFSFSITVQIKAIIYSKMTILSLIHPHVASNSFMS